MTGQAGTGGVRYSDLNGISLTGSCCCGFDDCYAMMERVQPFIDAAAGVAGLSARVSSCLLWHRMGSRLHALA